MPIDIPVLCVHCRLPVVTVTRYGMGGTTWTHKDGFMQCKPTYAAPDLITHARKVKEQQLKEAPPKKSAYHCDLCGHHMDSHFRNEEKCLRGSCNCVAYTKLEGEN